MLFIKYYIIIKMIKVKLIEKRLEGNEYQRVLKESKEFSKPTSFDNFISEISKAFKINKKGIELICITKDEEEIGINDQDDLNDYIEEAEAFHVVVEYMKETDKGGPTHFTTDDSFEINLDVKMEITDEELQNDLIPLFKEIKKDETINDNLEFDKKKYEQDLIETNQLLFNDYKKIFDINMKDIYKQKSIILKNILNGEMNSYSQNQINNISLYKNINGIDGKFSEMGNETKRMNQFMKELSENVNSNIKKKKQKQKKNTGVVIINEEGKEEGKEELNEIKNNTSLKVRFLDELREFEEITTKCKNIFINIEIENISEETLKDLYLVPDIEKSSQDFIIIQEDKTNFHKLTSTGDPFSPGKRELHTICLTIKYPKPDNTYNLYLYVRESEKGRNISKPLKIVYYVKQAPY